MIQHTAPRRRTIRLDMIYGEPEVRIRRRKIHSHCSIVAWLAHRHCHLGNLALERRVVAKYVAAEYCFGGDAECHVYNGSMTCTGTFIGVHKAEGPGCGRAGEEVNGKESFEDGGDGVGVHFEVCGGCIGEGGENEMDLLDEAGEGVMLRVVG